MSILSLLIAAFLLSACASGSPFSSTDVADSHSTEEKGNDVIVIGSDGRKADPAENGQSDADTIYIPDNTESGSVSDGNVASEVVIPDESENFEGYVLSGGDISENGVYLKSVKTPGEAIITFAGDIDFDDRYSNMAALRGRSNGILDSISPALISRMKDSDICMLNNEFPYSKRGTPTPNKKFTFRADPSTVSFLEKMGVDIVSLANNHAYDYGPDALLDTFDTLTNAGIPYVGAGHNLEEAKKPVYFIAGGMKIAFVSATQIERSLPPDTKEATETEPGVLRTLDPEKFVEVIRSAKADSDFVIVYVHWGSENVNRYEAAQHDLAKAYVDAGADLIMGDHPHVLQGFEYIDHVPVLYSLGNYWFNSKALDTCLIETALKDGSIKSLKFIPCRQQSCRTSEAEPGDGNFERILADMRSYSHENVSLDEEGYVTEK
ncbi:MAG: CapA family protein [Lachnospiraceae bacterium]|nr:CapA family protein [Lachnospiraceae bacterium]